MTEANKPQTVEAYIEQYPEEIQVRLRSLRQLIRDLVPEATEKISYGMPAYYFHGYLVYFGAFKNHIGFYPIPSGIKAFPEDLAAYKTSKGAIQFPHQEPLPFELVEKLVRFRVEENLLAQKDKK